MSSILKKVQPRPRKPGCKCCIAKSLRDSTKLARKEKGHSM